MDNGLITQKIQKKTFEMLVQLKDILERNNIRFFLAFGTMLGAVRHKGFIPWDDDIDIHIFGEDYPKLKQVFLTQDTGNLVLQDGMSVKNYPFVFPKVIAKDTTLIERSIKGLEYTCGVYIDIFPIFGVNRRRFDYLSRYFNYSVIRARYSKGGIVCFLSKFFSVKRCQKRLYKKTLRSVNGAKFFAEATTFDNRTYLSGHISEGIVFIDFEGVKMPVLTHYDEYLTHFYGDYNKLPKEQDRVSNHDFSTLVINGEKII